MRHTLDRLLARLSGATARRLLAPTRASRRRSRLVISYVDDPIDPIRLVRAAGTIDPVSLSQVLRSWEDVTSPHLVHLDLQDAAIADAVTMSRLESALDELELQRVDVRIVGIDPHHPAIAT